MLRRLARTYGDIGGRDTENPLLKMSAAAKIAEGSAISSADDAMDSAPLAQRQRQGALEQQKRSVLQPASLAPAGPAATLATARPPATGASLSPEAQRTSRMKFYADQQASRTGLAAARPPAAPPTAPTEDAGLGGSYTPGQLSQVRGWEKQQQKKLENNDLVGRGLEEPGNVADIRLRDRGMRLDKESILFTARKESANSSQTRGDVIDRLNKERQLLGKDPVEISNKEIADADVLANKKLDGENAPPVVAKSPIVEDPDKQELASLWARVDAAKKSGNRLEEERLTETAMALQNSPVKRPGEPTLDSARPVSTPTPVTPASAVTTAPVGVAPSPTTPSDPSKKTKGPSITTPQAIQDRADAALSEYRKKKKAEYDEVWNSAPNLPLLGEALGPQSGANKAYKSVRTFLSGKSY